MIVYLPSSLVLDVATSGSFLCYTASVKGLMIDLCLMVGRVMADLPADTPQAY